MRTSILALLTLVALVRSASAACRGPVVSTADQICSGAGTCQVTQQFCIVSGSTLDFAGRDLVLKKSGKLDVQGGSMLIKATSITLEGGSTLQGVRDSGGGGSIDIQATSGDIVSFKDALIDVGGTPARRVDLAAGGTG